MSTTPSKGRRAATVPGTPDADPDKPTPEELRAQARHTREELGRTVEALMTKTDVKTRAMQAATGMKDQLGEKVGVAREQIAATAATAGEKLRDTTPETVQDSARQAAEVARRNRLPLLAGSAAATLALLMVIRRRRSH
ncbi:DUF3618 domain-containing protein [Streptomyces sp. NPDC055709]